MILTALLAISSSLAAFLALKVNTLQKEQERLRNLTNEDSKVLFLKSRYASMGETLGNIAHQWKQPLNAIGTIQNSIKAALLFQGEISKEKLLSSVDTSFKLLQHLAETIDTFYSFLAQSGDSTSRFYLTDELEKVRKITEYSFENSNINLVFELEVNPSIQGNANELTHALLNLILNAKDAFDTLAIDNPTIIVRVIGREETCTITVSDNAGGIRIKPIDMVFDMHITSKENGSGLGLFMTKNIIEKRFGGSISVKNTKNGACFTIELPYADYNEQCDTLTRDEKLTLDRINQLSRKVIELEEVEKNLRKWSEIFKKAHWAIAMHVGTNNRFDLTNDAFNALYGYSAEEMRQLSVPDLFPPESLPILSEIQAIAFEKGYVAFESTHKRRDGSTFPVSVELMVIKDEDGEILYHMANIWDLSEQKAAQERLLLKKFALDHIRDAVFLIDANARFHYVNDGACNALGYTREELLQMSIGDVDPDWPNERWPEHWEELKQAGSITMELRHQRKDTTIFPVEVSANYIEYNGHYYNMAVARDITERKAAQEKLLLQTFALDQVNEAVFLIDENSMFHYVNEGACKALGYTKEELLRMGVVHLDPNVSIEWWRAHWLDIIALGTTLTQTKHIKKDGSFLSVEVSSNSFEYNGVWYSLAVSRDITERLALEAEKESRAIRVITENSPDIIVRFDLQGRRTYVNPKAAELFKIDMLGKTLLDVTPVLEKERFAEHLRHVLQTGDEVTFETAYINADGQNGWAHMRMVPELDGNSKIVSVLSIGRDMTELKNAYETLAYKERELRSLAESSPGMMGAYYMRPDGSVCMPYASPNIQEIFGITSEEIKEDATPLMALSHPDDVEMIVQTIHESAQTMSLWHIEYRIIHPTKGIRWMEGHTMPQPHPSGGVIWYGYVHDITERKEMEVSIQEAHDRYIQILDNSTDVIYLLDVTPEGKYIYVDVNAAYETVTGIPRDIVIGLCVDDIEDEIFRSILIDKFDSCLNAGCDTDYTADYPFPGGIRTFHSILTPIRDKSGRIIRIVGSARDITEQKAMEEQIRHSEENLKNAQKIAKLGSWHLDIQNEQLTWSDETYRIFELDRSEITDLHQSFYEHVHPEDRERVRGLYVESLYAKTSYELDHRIVMSDGRIKYVIERCEHTYAHDGTPLYSNGTVQDITERKLMEKELQDSHAFLTKLIDSLPDPIFVKDRDHKWLILNKANYEFAGIEQGSFIGKSDYDFFPKEEADIFWEKDEEVFKSGKVNVNEEYFTSSDGTTHYIQTIKAMFVGSDGKEYLVGTIRDLSERKAMEDDLRQALEFNEGVISAIPDMLFEIAPDGTYVGIWAQNEELLIEQRTALIGKNFKELMPPDVVITSIQAMKEVDEKGVSLGKTYSLDLAEGKRWFELSVSKKKMSGNYIALARDITERKLIEERLQSNRNLLHAILESSPGVVTFALDRNYRYLAFDSKHANVMHTLFGKDITIGMDMFEVIGSVEDAKIAKRSFDRALGGESFVAEEEYGDERLSCKYWQIFYSPIQSETGEIIGLTCFNVDISERRKAEEEIKGLNETLEERVIERTSQLQEVIGKLHREISERIKTEKALQTSEEMFRALVENSPDVISRYDLSMRRTYVNPMMQFLLNKPLDEILGKTPREFSPLPDVEVFEEMFKAVVYGKTELEHEGLYQTPWGEMRWGNQRLVPELDSEQNVTSVMVIGRDMSERIETEKRLMMVETAINSTTEAIYINDTSLKIIYVNDGACRMLGYSREELLTMHIVDIDAHYTTDEIHEFKASTLNESNIAFETRHRRKDGSIIDVEIVGTSFAYDKDEIILSVVKEITERKKMEKALRYREEYQRTLLDNFPYFVWLKDKESRLLAANIQYARVANVESTADLEGKTDFDFFPHDLSTKYVTDDQSVMREGKSKNVEEQYADEHGNIRWMETWKSPVWINQEIVGTVGCSRDITERKEMETALRESEVRYREIFDNTSDALYLIEVTPEGRYKNIAFNRAFEKSTGIDKTQLIGKYVDDFSNSESVRENILNYDRCVRLGEPIEECTELTLPSGRKMYRSILIPIKNEEGQVVRIIGLAREER